MTRQRSTRNTAGTRADASADRRVGAQAEPLLPPLSALPLPLDPEPEPPEPLGLNHRCRAGSAARAPRPAAAVARTIRLAATHATTVRILSRAPGERDGYDEQ